MKHRGQRLPNLSRCHGHSLIIINIVQGPLALLAFEGLSLHAECLFEIGRVSEAAAVINHGLGRMQCLDRRNLITSMSFPSEPYRRGPAVALTVVCLLRFEV